MSGSGTNLVFAVSGALAFALFSYLFGAVPALATGLAAGGDASSDPDFYQPLCVGHIPDYLPSVAPYLSLPPGFRFQIADGDEDVWFDPTLLSEG
jgi:hypothetical protein